MAIYAGRFLPWFGDETIKNQIQKIAVNLLAVVAVLLTFNMGQRLRIESLATPLHHANLLAMARLRGTSYMVTAKPDDANQKSSGAFLPTAVAADPSIQPQADSGKDGEVGQDASGSSDQQINDLLENDSPAATFQQVYLLLKDQYVDSIDSDSKLAHGAASALLASLDDPDSRFLEPDERKAIDQQSNGLFAGTGAVTTVRRVIGDDGLVERQITVIDAVPGSPAEKAGLKTGDVVTNIDKHWIIGYDPFVAQAKMFKKLATGNQFQLGKAIDAVEKTVVDGYSIPKAETILDTASTTPLVLTIQRQGTKPFDATLGTSSAIEVKDVEFRKLDDGNGYIGFNIFATDTAQSFSAAMTSLGAVKGLVIDLRDCSGGMLDPAVAIAHALAPSAQFGEIEVKDSQSTHAKTDNGIPVRVRPLDSDGSANIAPIAFSGPISVLVNKGTANAAELFADFLRDHMGAKVIGGSTFGDASAQTLFPLSDGSAFTLTTGVLKTDQGLAFNTIGIAPDVALPDPGHAGDPNDPGLPRAEALLASGQKPQAAAFKLGGHGASFNDGGRKL